MSEPRPETPRRSVVRGIVDDINDSDNIVSVIERVVGVEEAIDETELADG